MSIENNTEDSQVKMSKVLLDQIYTFIATSNNYLMTIPVKGDNVIASAKIMEKANELCLVIDEMRKDDV